jgi:hypothetical protein
MEGPEGLFENITEWESFSSPILEVSWAKFWANFEQILIKFRANFEQILSKFWAKFELNFEQILIKFRTHDE